MRKNSLIMGLILLVIGIIVLVFPDIIRWAIGIGLIVMGLLAMFRR
jgi:cytochrome c biogenesis protein CcdA